MVASGCADVVVAVGIEKMTEVDTPTSLAVGGRSGNYLWEFHFYGTTMPAGYALYATARMVKFRSTEQHMALVALNPRRISSIQRW